MAEITREKFKVVGKNISSMESISRILAGCLEEDPEEQGGVFFALSDRTVHHPGNICTYIESLHTLYPECK